ncbi:MAG: twin-arginine translocase subunit TatC [bacterium]
MLEDKKMPVTGHLEELRRRLIKIVIAIVIGTVVSYIYRRHILDFLQAPIRKVLKDDPLRFFSLMEPFVIHIKVSVYSGIFFAIPVVLYQVWVFVAPGMLPKERKYLLPFILMGTILFLFGAGLCYYAVLPYGTEFFINFDPSLKSSINIASYLSFTMQMIMIFGLVFELPLVLVLLAKIGLVTSVGLAKKRKYAILIIFIAAGVLTPTPDPLTQTIMAVPLIALYELSIILARIFAKQKEKTEGES